MTADPAPQVRQLRTVLLVDDLDAALAWYRDTLGMPEAMALAGPDGARVAILEAGRATLELGNAAQGRFIDEVESGGAPGTPVRLAVEVDDTDAVTERLAAAGGRVLGAPAVMPWGSRNSRLDGPGGVQVTVFAESGGAAPGTAEGGPPGWAGGPSVADRLRALVGRAADDLGGEAGLLAATVDLAADHAAAGGFPFVAVVVRDGVVVGAGANSVAATDDPAAHGEVEAVRDACRRAGAADLGGDAVVLSSCEPCAICRTVAAAAGVREIVWAADAAGLPDGLDDAPGRSAALAAAVSGVLPGIARRGAAVPDPGRPFRVWAGRASGAIT